MNESSYTFSKMNLISAILCLCTTAAAATGCDFPQRWRDSWISNGFKSNLHYEITRKTFSAKGNCLQSDGSNKYLLVRSRTDPETNVQRVCYTCIVFTIRHVNLIQYKEEIVCDPHNTDDGLLDRTCRRITGQSILYTLIRANAVPIACPTIFQRHLTFMYGNGLSAICQDANLGNSTIRKCASSTRLHMTFAQCRNPQYTRNEVEIQCLANWRVGKGDWLYVKYGKNDYRCMNYDQSSRAMGITGDASCSGISILYDAPIYITWAGRDPTPAKSAAEKCTYPQWFTQREWSDLQSRFIYRYDIATKELVVDKYDVGDDSYTETSQRYDCHQKISESTEKVQYITRVIDECKHGYKCVILRRKTDSVIEMVTGDAATSPSHACSSRKLNSPQAETRLLVDSNAKAVRCPETGIYSLPFSSPRVRGRCRMTLEMGCSVKQSSIVIKQCDVMKTELLCLASWTEEGINRLVISKSSYPRSGNCYRYTVGRNQEITLNLDEQCNYNAPLILDSSYPHPPFRLPPPAKRCKRVVHDRERQKQAGKDNSKNLPQNSPGTRLCTAYILLIFSILVTVV